MFDILSTMRKILSFFIIAIFLISLTSATIDLKTTKQGDHITLYQSCPTCTYSDIRAIKYPNGTTQTVDYSMTQTNYDFTYEFNNTLVLGEYTYTVCGNKGGLSYESCEEGVFIVTPNGKIFDTQNSVSYLGFIIVILFMFLLSLYGSIKIKWRHKKTPEGQVIGVNELRYVKIFLFAMDYILMMFIFGLSYKFFYESGIDGFYNFFFYGYKIFESFLIPILFVTIILWVVIFLTNLKLKKNRQLGL